MADIEKRLSALGIVLPTPPVPVANYVPFKSCGKSIFLAGQVPIINGFEIKGTVGVEVDIPMAVEAARMCAINLIAAIKYACDGDLNQVKQIVRIGGFVQAGEGFSDIAQVLNGASDLIVDLFGEKGRHVRTAVGVYRLPFGCSVEIDGVFEKL